MKQKFFDIDSPEQTEELKNLLIEMLAIDGNPTPKVIVYDIPDNMVLGNDRY